MIWNIRLSTNVLYLKWSHSLLILTNSHNSQRSSSSFCSHFILKVLTWFVLLCCIDASIHCFSSFYSSSLTISPLNCVITSHSVSLAECCCRAHSCVSVPAGRSSCRWTVTPPSWTATGGCGTREQNKDCCLQQELTDSGWSAVTELLRLNI